MICSSSVRFLFIHLCNPMRSPPYIRWENMWWFCCDWDSGKGSFDGFFRSYDFLLWLMVLKSLMPITVFLFLFPFAALYILILNWIRDLKNNIYTKHPYRLQIGVSTAYLETNHRNKCLSKYKAYVWYLHLKVTFVIFLFLLQFKLSALFTMSMMFWQDDCDNVTRFLILAREPIIPGLERPYKV